MDQEKLLYEFIEGEPYVQLQSLIEVFAEAVEVLDNHMKAYILLGKWQQVAKVDSEAEFTAQIAALFIELKKRIDVNHLNKSLEES